MNKQNVNNQRYIFIFGVLLLTGVILYALRSVLLPFVVGILVAYFLDPLVNKMTLGGKISRSLASVGILILFLLILLPILVFLGGVAFSQISDFAVNLPEYVNTFKSKFLEFFKAVKEYFPGLTSTNIDHAWQGNIGATI